MGYTYIYVSSWTDSIQFGPYEEMLAAAKERVRVLHEQGLTEARHRLGWRRKGGPQ